MKSSEIYHAITKIDQCNVKRKTGSYQVVKLSSINTFKNKIGAVKKAINNRHKFHKDGLFL